MFQPFTAGESFPRRAAMGSSPLFSYDKGMDRTRKTSASHPLRVDAVTTPGGGLIGMTFCPGKSDPWAPYGPWQRDLDMDLDAVRDFGASALVTLMELEELEAYGVPPADLERGVIDRGMAWHHLPITDMDVPRLSFERGWQDSGPALRGIVRDGGRIVVHCFGGLGRTGTVAALMLVEFGIKPQAAIDRVRVARPGTVQTLYQERYVLEYGAGSSGA